MNRLPIAVSCGCLALLALATPAPGQEKTPPTIVRDGSLLTLRGPLAYSVAFQPDGKQLATGCKNQVVLWDAITGKQIRALDGHKGIVAWVAFSPDGQRLFAADTQNIKAWNPATGAELFTIPSKGYKHFVLTPDGKQWPCCKKTT